MNNLDVRIIGKYVYLNGCRLNKKFLDPSSHCRDIFYNNEFVVKVETEDTPQNEDEYRRYLKIHKKDKKFFAEVIDVDKKRFRYLVQKRYFFKGYSVTKKTNETLIKMSEKYNLIDVYFDEKKRLRKNFGMIAEDYPLIYDYGI